MQSRRTRSELCVRAVEIFVSMYGAEAGNLALKLMATGGIFVGGGIAPKILRKLRAGEFMAAFVHKGRFERLLRDVGRVLSLTQHAQGEVVDSSLVATDERLEGRLVASSGGKDLLAFKR